MNLRSGTKKLTGAVPKTNLQTKSEPVRTPTAPVTRENSDHYFFGNTLENLPKSRLSTKLEVINHFRYHRDVHSKICFRRGKYVKLLDSDTKSMI